MTDTVPGRCSRSQFLSIPTESVCHGLVYNSRNFLSSVPLSNLVRRFKQFVLTSKGVQEYGVMLQQVTWVVHVNRNRITDMWGCTCFLLF